MQASRLERRRFAPPACAGTAIPRQWTSNRTRDIGPRSAASRNQGIWSYQFKRPSQERSQIQFRRARGSQTNQRLSKNSISRAYVPVVEREAKIGRAHV